MTTADATSRTATQRRTGFPRLTSLGHELPRSPDKLGWLRPSLDVLGDAEALRARMWRDGYLYLPGYLDRGLVLEARRSVTGRLSAAGLTDPRYPADEAVAPQGSGLQFKPDLAHDNEPLHRLLYDGSMVAFYERFLGGPVRHYDFTWMRAKATGHGTPPHGDVVFMGRGTHDLYTSWVPLGPADFESGGLMVLEGSNRLPRIRNNYGTKDVDRYCLNRPDAPEYASGEKWWNGWLGDDPVLLRERLGGRWLTTEYEPGDLLVFSCYTVHGSLDNHSRSIRLSSDSRYQLASEPIDERWIGESPPAHGPNGKRGLIC